MKIVSLNIRGWGVAAKGRRLRTFLQSGNFDCCFIQKMKLSSLPDRAVESLRGSGACYAYGNRSI